MSDQFNYTLYSANDWPFFGKTSLIYSTKYDRAWWDDNHKNFCRNIDMDPNGPWCFVGSGRHLHQEYCDFVECSDIKGLSINL